MVSVLSALSTGVGMLAMLGLLPRVVVLLWPLGLFAGVAGLVLSLQELGAISRGESPAAGRRLAAQGRTVSIVHLSIIALFFAGLFVAGFIEGFSRHR